MKEVKTGITLEFINSLIENGIQYIYNGSVYITEDNIADEQKSPKKVKNNYKSKFDKLFKR
jgi:hypothetical protein